MVESCVSATAAVLGHYWGETELGQNLGWVVGEPSQQPGRLNQLEKGKRGKRKRREAFQRALLDFRINWG